MSASPPGSGLGATGTRSVAAAVDALGIPTCHKFDKYVELLNLTRNDPTDVGIFAQFGPRAFFDTPMATLWPRLACAFPNYKLIHTTRAYYHRHYDEAYCAQERKWKTKACRGRIGSATTREQVKGTGLLIRPRKGSHSRIGIGHGWTTAYDQDAARQSCSSSEFSPATTTPATPTDFALIKVSSSTGSPKTS